MKKFLSLVLALVMTMSLVTISAGAKDFTDNSKITYNEAVDVVSALKIVDGYEDGAFNPTNTLTRGAAAKIICNMILGPTTASALSADTAPFSDVPTNNVFAGYITYCSQKGIISGYADGTFRPAATLTGYAFMKMLLGALGYDSTIEGFVGANWSVSVGKLALGIGLADGNKDFVGTKAVTREEACLYAFNTLTAAMVEYDGKTSVSVSGVEVVVGGSEAKKIAQGSSKDKLGDEDYLQFGEEYFSDLKMNDAGDDAFGRPCTQWKIKNDEIGKYAKTADATYTAEVKGKTIRADLGDDYDFEQVKEGDAKKDAYYVDGDRTDLPGSFAVAKNNDKKVGGNGVLTEVYVIEGEDDEDDTVRVVSINTYLAQVSGDYDKDDEELTLTGVDSDDVTDVGAVVTDSDELVLSSDDFDNLADFEDEDYVLVTVASGEIKSIAAAEKVTASVTNYEDEDSVTADGTTYKYNKTYSNSDADTKGKSDGYTIKDEYDLYLDQYGYVMFADGVEAEGRYVYIEDSYTASNSGKAAIKANAYFLDGTNSEITVNKVGGDKVQGKTGVTKVVTGWYSYSMKSDKYDLKVANVDVKTVLEANETDKITSKDTVSIIVNDITIAKGTKNTVYLVIDEDDDVSVYTGTKKVPETYGKDVKVTVVFEKDTSYAKYVCIDLGDNGTAKGGAKSGDVIFIYKDSYDKRGTDADENVYYSFKAVKNGEVTKVKFDDSCDDLGLGLYVDIEYDGSGYVAKYTEVAEDATYDATDDPEDFSYQIGLTDEAISQKNGIVTVDGVSYYLADDAKIMVIDDGDMKTVTAKKLASDYKACDVFGVMNSNSEYTYLFINTDKA